MRLDKQVCEAPIHMHSCQQMVGRSICRTPDHSTLQSTVFASSSGMCMSTRSHVGDVGTVLSGALLHQAYILSTLLLAQL
jgi:hypothetical protein